LPALPEAFKIRFMPSAIRRINLPLENHYPTLLVKKNPREGEKGKHLLVPKISVESPLAGSGVPFGALL
jgi:hypothetical protein